MPERWRVGRTLGRTLYIQAGDEPSKDDRCVGMLDTRELAERVVAAMNAAECAPPDDTEADGCVCGFCDHSKCPCDCHGVVDQSGTLAGGRRLGRAPVTAPPDGTTDPRDATCAFCEVPLPQHPGELCSPGVVRELQAEVARLRERLGQYEFDERYEAMATAGAFDEEDPF